MSRAPIIVRSRDFSSVPAVAVRQMAAFEAELKRALVELDLLQGPMERTASIAIGHNFPPLRGHKLLEAMDRAEAQAA